MTSSWDRLKNFWCCTSPERAANRTVFVGDKPASDVQLGPPEIYPQNEIISSRYTVWNFIPKNLFEQFRRIANFYFLVVGIIQLAIDTPVSPATSIVPLVFVVSVTAIKQGYEDWLRHKSDREVNERNFEVIRDGRLTTIKSMHIKVGDIIRVNSNKGFPCDMVMLSSADPEGNCYITTANLDGETNLKTHSCIAETKRCVHEDDFHKLTAFIECQQPIADLYTFVGNLTIVRDSGEHILKPLGPENILLRGARLKNTPFIYGCAIYTGQETKMALNSKQKSTKFSRVERKMNTFLLVFLAVMFLEAAFSTGMKHWYVARPKVGQPWYVPDIHKDAQVTAKRVFEDFLAYVVLYNYIIPISLYVTIEMQKFIGSMFFDWDLDMYDPDSNEHAKANTSDLNEELGQVEILFTDKTGTLTENDMQFRMCAIGQRTFEEVGGMLCEISPASNTSDPVPIYDEAIETFLTVLVLCHNVRVDHPETELLGASNVYSYTGFDYEYSAPSPDEKAFVEACRRYGVVYHGIYEHQHEVTFKGEMRRYKRLHVLEFDPTRKRMSVIVQNESGEIYLLCKGAESAMLDRVTDGDKTSTLFHVNQYAMLGLRTLVIGLRKLEPEEYKQIDATLMSARKALQDRAAKLAEAYDAVEQGLTVLGSTAVEDKLQDDVPETIVAMHRAGIKVWVLTGDKQETAVNISYSAGHFQQGMFELHITGQESSMDCADVICGHMHVIDTAPSRSQKFSLIIDGVSLTHCLLDHYCILRKLCIRCAAVLCCRMSPLQKAQIVKMMKGAPGQPVTAAIGDGANDVSMIQEADVGLGIMGKEGRQAVRNSDYAFAKFRFLMKALLVHGHTYYARIAVLVQYFFYKNIAFCTAQLFYAFYTAFSQQSLYESFYLMMFNMVFTAMPILMYGIFEQHLKPSLLMQKPELYKKVTKNEKMSFPNFLIWNGLGLWHCVVMFFGMMILAGDTSVFPDGQMIGNWTFGSMVYFGVILIVSIKLALSTYYWSGFIWFGFLTTAVTYFIGTTVYNMIWWPSFIKEEHGLLYVFNTSLQSLNVWLVEVILIVIALIPDLILKIYRDTTFQWEITQQAQYSRKSSKDKYSMGFNKRSGKLTLSQLYIIDDDNSDIGNEETLRAQVKKNRRCVIKQGKTSGSQARNDASLVPLRRLSTEYFGTKFLFPNSQYNSGSVLSTATTMPNGPTKMDSQQHKKIMHPGFTYRKDKQGNKGVL